MTVIDPDYQADAYQLSRYLFFELLSVDAMGNGRLRVMCNYCTSTHHVFFEGEATDLTGSDWLAQAAIHAANAHKGR